MNLAAYRTAVRRALGDGENLSGDWTDELIDEGLRGGLLVYAQAAPFAEAELTVTVAEREQDLSAVDPDLLTVVSVAWPWDAGQIYTAQRADVEFVGGGRVRFVDGEPQVGDVIRFRYARAYRIEGLDGAASTTVPEVARGDGGAIGRVPHLCRAHAPAGGASLRARG